MTLVLSGNTGSALDGIKNSLMFLETAKATTSGTSIDFTGIPSWAKKITVMFNGVSTNGTSNILVQIGTSSGIETTSYTGTVAAITTTPGVNTLSTGFTSDISASASAVRYGHLILISLGSNLWSASGCLGATGINYSFVTGGVKTLSGTLDRLRITTVNGTDTFDAGSINILIEGYV
jgi:hypothetical protein